MVIKCSGLDRRGDGPQVKSKRRRRWHSPGRLLLRPSSPQWISLKQTTTSCGQRQTIIATPPTFSMNWPPRRRSESPTVVKCSFLVLTKSQMISTMPTSEHPVVPPPAHDIYQSYFDYINSKSQQLFLIYKVILHFLSNLSTALITNNFNPLPP